MRGAVLLSVVQVSTPIGSPKLHFGDETAHSQLMNLRQTRYISSQAHDFEPTKVILEGPKRYRCLTRATWGISRPVKKQQQNPTPPPPKYISRRESVTPEASPPKARQIDLPPPNNPRAHAAHGSRGTPLSVASALKARFCASISSFTSSTGRSSVSA